MGNAPISTAEVAQRLGLTESGLRHLLRRPDAPRPPLHPTARLLLWSEADVRRLTQYRDKLLKAKEIR